MNKFSTVKYSLIYMISVLLLLSGCNEDSPKSSKDMIAFNHIVAIDIPFKTVTWEVFGTPEHTGGIPGPTDYITLVAQVEPSDAANFDQLPSRGSVWVAPESARPWMQKDFQQLLRVHKGKEMEIAKKQNCKAITAVLKKSLKHAEGFVCRSGTKMLIYIPIASFT